MPRTPEQKERHKWHKSGFHETQESDKGGLSWEGLWQQAPWWWKAYAGVFGALAGAELAGAASAGGGGGAGAGGAAGGAGSGVAGSYTPMYEIPYDLSGSAAQAAAAEGGGGGLSMAQWSKLLAGGGALASGVQGQQGRQRPPSQYGVPEVAPYQGASGQQMDIGALIEALYGQQRGGGY